MQRGKTLALVHSIGDFGSGFSDAYAERGRPGLRVAGRTGLEVEEEVMHLLGGVEQDEPTGNWEKREEELAGDWR